MSTVANQPAYVPFTVLDTDGSAVTGKVNSDFTKTAFLASTPATTATPTVTEVGSVRYVLSVTPTTAGTWYVAWSVVVSGRTLPYSETLAVASVATVGSGTTGADYCTLAELKAQLNREDDTVDDAWLSATITRVSRAIDNYCNRRFYQVTEARYFDAEYAGSLIVDDLVSVSEIATDISGTRQYITLWQTTDYDLSPANAAGIGFPYTKIEQQPYTSQWFPKTRRGVRITGVWGWPAVPDAITGACVLQAIRIFKRRDTPYGIAGSIDLGQMTTIPKIDPDVRAFLDPYRRITVTGI